jgi:heme-degrading monooxygenase HmoA
MHAQITFVKARPDAKDEAAKIWLEEVLSNIKGQKGNEGAELCFCEAPVEESIAITFWESKEDADAGRASDDYKNNMEKFASFFTAPPETKDYDVVSWGSK